MLRVVQTAAWDWAPPHMSGYPHLPPPRPQYQQSYHADPQRPSYPALPRGPPPPPPHGEPPRGPPPSLPYGAPPRGAPPSLPYGAPPRGPPPALPYGAPLGATGEPPELHPKALLGPFTDVAQIKKVRGRLQNQPDRTSSVAAFNAWFVRSREAHVCGAPVSSAQCSATRLPPLCFHRIRRRPARRGTFHRASEQKDLASVRWRRSRSVCCVLFSVLLCRLQRPLRSVLRVLRCHCRLRVMPGWFCYASGIRPGACYVLHVSRFWPFSGGQHPVFRVLKAPVRVKEEPPDSPERHAEPEGAPNTETAAEGKMTDGEIQEL